MSTPQRNPEGTMHQLGYHSWRRHTLRLAGLFIVAGITALLSACGGGMQRPTFKTPDQFNAYVDTMPKAGVIDLTDAAFRALVLQAATLDEDAFERCIMEPLRDAFLDDDDFLLMLPDSSVTAVECAASNARRFYWRMTNEQRQAWVNTDVMLRERFVNTVATYRAALQNDPKVRLRYNGLERIPDSGYRELQAARLSLGDGLVYSVNLR